MRFTDDERRAVAARLREKHEERASQLLIGPQYAEMRALGCLRDLESCVPDGESLFAVLADLVEPGEVTGSTSDGYHTFDELYDHKAKLFSVVVAAFRGRAWKSRLHSDGTMYDGMFVVGIDTPWGQATYHCDVEPYWGMFDCAELPKAPGWDGHTPRQAIGRIARLSELAEPSCDRGALPELAARWKEDS